MLLMFHILRTFSVYCMELWLVLLMFHILRIYMYSTTTTHDCMCTTGAVALVLLMFPYVHTRFEKMF